MWLSLDMHLSDAMMGEISELLKVFERDSMQESEKSDFVASKLKTYYYIFDQHSAYAEVRASISNTDDPSLPAETFRVWFIGLGMVAMFASMNQVPFRYQQVLIGVLRSSFPPNKDRCVGLSSDKLPIGCGLCSILAYSQIPCLWIHLFSESGSVQSEGAHPYYGHGHCWCRYRLRSLDFRDTDPEDVFQPTLGSK